MKEFYDGIYPATFHYTGSIFVYSSLSVTTPKGSRKSL